MEFYGIVSTEDITEVFGFPFLGVVQHWNGEERVWMCGAVTGKIEDMYDYNVVPVGAIPALHDFLKSCFSREYKFEVMDYTEAMKRALQHLEENAPGDTYAWKMIGGGTMVFDVRVPKEQLRQAIADRDRVLDIRREFHLVWDNDRERALIFSNEAWRRLGGIPKTWDWKFHFETTGFTFAQVKAMFSTAKVYRLGKNQVPNYLIDIYESYKGRAMADVLRGSHQQDDGDRGV
jgi:hypothetical protein